MAESFVQVPPDSTGKKLRTLSHDIFNQTVHQQVYHISDFNNPENMLSVDENGQASIRFAEGSPTMDAFGNLRVSQGKFLAGYEYTNGDMNDLFTDEIVGAAALTRDANASEMIMSVSGASGDLVTRTSNRYHYYQPGIGNYIIQTLALSDTGREGNIRRWGYFDEFNGIFWELDGTQLSVVIRSNTTGVVTEERVSQQDWNKDKLDGFGLSQMDIDVSKANFYFIDFAWLGVGEVRAGVLAPDGSRRICHIFQNPNNNIHAYMATGSLPSRYENFNTVGTGGTSQIRLICTGIYAESQTDYTFWRYSDVFADNKQINEATTPIATLKPKLYFNGKPNRIGIYPCGFSIFVTGGTIKLHVIDDAELVGANFIEGDPNSSVVFDNSATAITSGSTFLSCFKDAGSHDMDLSRFYETNDEGYHTLADLSDSYSFTVAAEKVSGADVRAWVVVNYRELR